MQLFASFSTNDHISGNVRVILQHTSVGKGIKSPYARLNLSNVESNSVIQLPFEHTNYELHLSKLLTEMTQPTRIVDDFEINHINRRFFGGEKAIKMLEGVLGFESNLSAINRWKGNGGLGFQQNQPKRFEREFSNTDERRDHRRPRYDGGGANQ